MSPRIKRSLRRIRAGQAFVCLLLVFAVLLSACAENGRHAEEVDAEQLAAERRKVELLTDAANELHRLTSEGRLAEARDKLQYMNDLVVRIRYQGITTAQGLQALIEAMDDAVREYNRVMINEADSLAAAARLVLATDALLHRNEPLWLQYETLLAETFAAARDAAAAKNERGAKEAFDGLVRHFSVIRPAVIITRGPAEVERLDSLIGHIKQQLAAEQPSFAALENGFNQLAPLLDELFNPGGENTAFLPLDTDENVRLWTVLIGTFIAAILFYYSWHMHRSGKAIARIPPHRH